MTNLNTLTKLLDLYPEKEWNYNILSINPSIDLEYVNKHHDKAWNMKSIYEYKHITEEYIEKNQDKIIWYHLSYNINLIYEYNK